MTAESTTSVDAAQSAGGTSAAQQYDYGTNRTQDVDKDTGADERYEVMGADRADAWGWNGKRTYDLHQTLDTQALVDKAKHQAKLDSMEVRHADEEHKMKMRHMASEHEQRLRHADRDHSTSSTVMVALLGDMAEKLGVIATNTSK